MAKLEALPKRIRLDEGRIILHKIRYNPPHRYAGKVNRNWHVTFNIARGYRKIISTQTPILSKAKQFARNKANELTATIRAFMEKKNMGLIFPSWLEHYVPPALCTRVSLSWNILPRGEYGNPNTLQNAYI